MFSTPHRPVRLSAAAPRASAIETSIDALGDPRTQEEVRAHSVEIHPEFTLAFVELDDQGRFWSRKQVDLVERTLEAENSRPGISGVAVVIFAHGWRHGCDVCDTDVTCFRTFLKQLYLDGLAASRVSGGRVLPKRIVAVYAGWRGLSSKVQPFEDLSFWSRKSVAQRIAGGDFIELLTRVELYVRRVNAQDPERARLATIGHSFGGTMVYAALANILKERVLEAAAHQDAADPSAYVIRGFGNLVVLINPAFEASQYAPLHDLSSSFHHYAPTQSPILVTIASETDRSNSMWFPLGRRIDTLFQSTGDQSPRREIVTAVGNYEKFWTHRLTAAEPPPPAPPAGSRAAQDQQRLCACALALQPLREREAEELAALFLNRESRPMPAGTEIRYGRALLTCLKAIEPGNPFWVVRASDDVIHGHSGIFTSYLIDFVRRVIIEANVRSRPLVDPSPS